MNARGWLAAAALALLLPQGEGTAGGAAALPPPDHPWSFAGPFGRFDQAALRRGHVVFMEACASCHSLRHVAYRNLSALGVGYSPEDIAAFAAQFQVEDGPNEDGLMFKRPARPSDRFVNPYPNVQAAQRANKGMVPPDLSLITRARKGGPDYLRAFLLGYEEEKPDDFELTAGMRFNPYAPGRQTGMPPVLFEDLIEFEDGTPATVEQMAADVTHFLAWAADPHMDQRKSLGIRVVIFLALLTLLFIALKQEVWAHLKRPRPGAPAPTAQ